MFPCGTLVGGAQHNSRCLKGNFREHLRELAEWVVRLAQPHQSPVEAIRIIEKWRTIELPHMLLLTHKQFALTFINVYLHIGQPIIEDGLHQLIVFGWIRPVQ